MVVKSTVYNFYSDSSHEKIEENRVKNNTNIPFSLVFIRFLFFLHPNKRSSRLSARLEFSKTSKLDNREKERLWEERQSIRSASSRIFNLKWVWEEEILE